MGSSVLGGVEGIVTPLVLYVPAVFKLDFGLSSNS